MLPSNKLQTWFALVCFIMGNDFDRTKTFGFDRLRPIFLKPEIFCFLGTVYRNLLPGRLVGRRFE
jgi:hypothetical protein